MSESKPPNPFECACRLVGVTVTLAQSDITDVWHSLSSEQAARLLDTHGAEIAAQMLVAGVEAAVEIIKRESV